MTCLPLTTLYKGVPWISADSSKMPANAFCIQGTTKSAQARKFFVGLEMNKKEALPFLEQTVLLSRPYYSLQQIPVTICKY